MPEIVNSPSPKDFARGRERHQLAVAAWIPGEVVIIGTGQEICCAVRVQDSRMEQTERGPLQVQRAFAMIAKSDLQDRLAQGTTVRINGLGYKVAADPADNAHDESWTVEFTRTPGGDE